MIDRKRILAVVPARSGSRGLKDKNIRPLDGRPLLYYSIAAATACSDIDYTIVSTDSEEYARISRECGAQVPFLRTEANSSDSASSMAVVQEVVEHLEEIGERFDIVILLQPTSPLRSAEDITGALALFVRRSALAVVSVCDLEHPISWMGPLDPSYSLDGFIKPEYRNKRRQDLPAYYRLNGAIYILSRNYISQSADLYQAGCYAFVMPAERSIDIDSIYDFVCAEALIRNSVEHL